MGYLIRTLSSPYSHYFMISISPKGVISVIRRIRTIGISWNTTDKRHNSVWSNMSPARTNRPLEVLGSPNFRIGAPLNAIIKGSNGPTMIKGKDWSLPEGAYTARHVVEAVAPLLEIVLHHLGPNPVGETPAREMLLDNLSWNLSLGNRGSSLTIPLKNSSSAEMAKQANIIGKTLVEYAQSATDVQYDPEYVIRSPCEGHLWKQPVAELIFGSRSSEHLAQIYNEYLHQLILLRDSLLPYENYEDVVIPIEDAGGRKRGMRLIEGPRSAFLMEILSKSITQEAVFNFAKSLLAPNLVADNSYGFQYEHGIILPSFITGGNSIRLFRFIPAVIDESMPLVAFQYQLRDYYTATRSEITSADDIIDIRDKLPLPKSAVNVEEHGEVTLVPLAKGLSTASRQLQLSVAPANTEPVNIDLGQITRGRRYAYAIGKAQGAAASKSSNTPVHVHSAWKVLTESGPGLVTAKEGIHLISAGSNVELLALLGKIYPENVIVVKEGEHIEAAQAAGKGLPDSGRFIIQTKGDVETIMPNQYQDTPGQ